MPRWFGRFVALVVMAAMTCGWVEPAFAASGQVVTYTPPPTESAAATDAMTDGAKNMVETAQKLTGLWDELMLALAGSPLLVRVLANQMQKFSNTKLQSWARESYFLVDQAVAQAQRTGALDGQKAAKATLYKEQFGKILQQAGWLERIALRATTGQEQQIFDRAVREAETINHRTYQGAVVQLEADGYITQKQALEHLNLQRRAILTPHELGSNLLTDTELRSADILELMRTYDPANAAQPIRVKGGRDSHYNATVLELLEPWRDPKRAKFQTRLDRKTVAKLLAFDGTVDDFTRTVIAETGMTGDEAQRLVNEYSWEQTKNRQFVDTLQPRSTGQADGPGAPKTAAAADVFDDVVNRAAKTAAAAPTDTGAVLEFKTGRSTLFSKWTGGGLQGAKQSLHYDAFRGGIFVDVGITAATNLLYRLKAGQSVGESLSGTVGTIMSTEFLLGDLLGGTIGAALGAAIPLPAALQSMGLLGRFFGVLPGVSLAIAGAQLGYGAVSLIKRGQFSLKVLFNEVKPGLVLGQALGAALGMTLGSLLLPGPIGALLGGMVGGILGSKLAAAIFGYAEAEAVAQTARLGDGLPGAPSVTDMGGVDLSDIDLNRPDADDMARVDAAVRSTYDEYLARNRSGDHAGSLAAFKRYVGLQKVLDELMQKGYRVK